MSPSEPSGSSSQALPNTEKEQLLARIQELEAAEHSEHTDWLTQTSLSKDDELRRSDSRALPILFLGNLSHKQAVHKHVVIFAYHLCADDCITRADSC